LDPSEKKPSLVVNPELLLKFSERRTSAEAAEQRHPIANRAVAAKVEENFICAIPGGRSKG
jgi:hypothetical protein